MKRLVVTVSHSVRIAIVAGTTVLLAYPTSAMAQGLPGPLVPPIIDQSSLARLAADLAYPNSAQRFFEAGRAQFEQEIRRLSDEDEQLEPLLTVKPEILEQFED